MPYDFMGQGQHSDASHTLLASRGKNKLVWDTPNAFQVGVVRTGRPGKRGRPVRRKGTKPGATRLQQQPDPCEKPLESSCKQGSSASFLVAGSGELNSASRNSTEPPKAEGHGR